MRNASPVFFRRTLRPQAPAPGSRALPGENVEEIVSIMESGRTLTRRERALYRTSTGLVLAVMLFSIVNFVFNDHFPFPNGPEGAFVHLGFPPYFKVELTVAKILGVLALVIPTVPFKVKEFAYAGFAITLVSAAIAHFGRGDARNLSVLFVVDPLIFFCLLAVSYYYFEKSHSLEPAAITDEAARQMRRPA
jgi:DoxX-like protein